MKDDRRLLLKGIILAAILGLLIWKFAVPRAVGPTEMVSPPEKVAVQSSAEIQCQTVPPDSSNAAGTFGVQTGQAASNGQFTSDAAASNTSNPQQNKPAGGQEEVLPVWLLFRSTTCIPCIEMQKTMDTLQPEFKGKIKFVAIDVNDRANEELLTKYQIRYIPTTYLYDRNKQLYFQQVGAMSVEEMRSKLQALVEVK